METTIFYFSGTGNSLAVAKSVAQQLDNCQLKSVAKAMEQEEYKVSSPKVGFVFPLYYVGIPKIVQEFIKRIELDEAKYIFIVITRGWPIVGGAINQMKHLLKERGKKLNAGVYIQLPMNDITLLTVAAPNVQAKLFSKAPERINKIIRIIERFNKHYDWEPLGFLWPSRNIPFINRVNSEDKYFMADSNCNGCGICAKICPVKNIIISDNKPQWSGRCEQCLACYHFCPQKAISFNNRENGVQYHHPDIKLTDFLN